MKTMKKIYFIALLALICNFASAQIERVAYQGAFAPAPAAMWTDSWTNWDPNSASALYTDSSTVVNVTANITSNTTWTADKTYKLNGLIYVTNNATLTIEQGTLIKGVYTSTGTALVITKGAKLNAIGTASQPIVFTSAKAAGSRAAGDWGGIILLGKAGFNINGGVNNIEGITASAYTEYGGGSNPIDTDNSGTMKYCRIEFPGFVFSPNNEINGLTFGAVGNGTTIDYVQVSYSGDDSFEWFGGAVNCKHLVAFKGVDDDFDTDNGYKGVVQFALGVRDPAISDNPSISTSEGFESDNNAGGIVLSGTDVTSCIFSNCTLIGPANRAILLPNVAIASGHARAARLRRASAQKIFNSIFLDFKQNFLFIDGQAASDNAVSGALKFKNNILAGALDSPSSGTAFRSGFNLNGTNPSTIPSYLSSNTVVNTSNGVLLKAYDTTSSNYSAGNDYSSSTTTLDYRPGTAAATGADFTDSSLSSLITVVAAGDFPTVANVNYCKGATPVALTATLRGSGTDLKFYTRTSSVRAGVTSYTYTQVSGAALIPSTSTAVIKTYYATQMNGTTESDKGAASFTVTVNANPTEVLTAISGTDPSNTNTTASISAVGKYVGTSSSFTYTTSGKDSADTYSWTVPNGINVLNGQAAGTITVNYANTPAGAGALGTISVQSVNRNGCKSAAKTLAITKALPAAATTLTLYNKNAGYATPTKAVTDYSIYMGKNTPLKLTAGVAATSTATAFKWELPEGVHVAIPQDSVSVSTSINTYTAEPFLSPNTPATTVAGKYWVVTKNAYTYKVDGVPTTTTISTAKQNIVGSGSCKFTLTGTVGSVINVGTVFTYNGEKYVLSTATGVNDTSLTCAVVFPYANSNYPTLTTSSTNTATIGTLTSADGSISKEFKKIDVTFPRTYTFTVTALTSTLAANTSLIYNSDTYVTTAAYAVGATSIVCRPGSFPQTAGNYPSAVTTNTPSGTTTTLTKPDNSTIAFTKIVKANYDSTISKDYLPYGTVITSNLPSISVKFDGVTNPTTTKLYLGVKAINGVGYTAVNNTANTDYTANNNIPGLKETTYTDNWTGPNSSTLTNGYSSFSATGATLSTAKLLALTAAAPAAPATLYAYAFDVAVPITSTTTKVTDISNYIGVHKNLILVAAPSVLATSYKWQIPAGAFIMSSCNATPVTGEPNVYSTTSNQITLEFNDVQATTAGFYYVGVKAVNAIRDSQTTNAGVTPTTTYKLLKLTATAPAAVTGFIGDITGLVCDGVKAYSFTASASAKALRYKITAPAGSKVYSTANPLTSTSTNELTLTNEVAFSVKYPSTFAIITATSTANKSLVIRAINNIGGTDLPKALTTAAFIGTIGAHTSTTTTTALAKFKTCQVKNISVPVFADAVSYVWTVADGAVITDANQTTRTINVNFSALASTVQSTIVTVTAINSCGVSSTVKTIPLTKEACTSATNKEIDENTISLASNTEMYPNPATDEVNFNIDATSNGVIDMTIYALDGKVVMESKGLTVENGTNSFTENVSSLNKGIYLVRITNTTSNEVVTKKLIKN